MVVEFLFWFHLLLILFALFAGLILPWWLVLIAAALHRVQIIVFGGCLLSLLQERLGGLPEGLSFLQYATSRLLEQTISYETAHLLDLTIVSLCLMITLLRHLPRFAHRWSWQLTGQPA